MTTEAVTTEVPAPAVAPVAAPAASDTPVLKRPYGIILKECSGTFIDCLLPTRALLGYLCENGVLSDRMVQTIVCRANRGDKVAQLLEFLTTLGPQSFVAFVSALRHTQQLYLANILAANIVEPQQ